MKQLPIFALLLLFACNTVQEPTETTPAAEKEMAAGHFTGGLTDYWYEGKAEINTYELQQARYGEIHPGQVSMIFVSEDFLTDRQVKNDNYTNPASTGIIKTNMIRRFTTGVYDYSVMSSVFTPTKTDEQPHTLKVTTSMQDWCGQTFTQLNHDGGGAWDAQLRSYFEKEGDTNETIPADFLEDEIFNRIRSNAGDLPTGKFNVIPSTAYLLMMHKPYKAYEAEVILGGYEGDLFDTPGLMRYTLNFTDLDRSLDVYFDAKPPYVIRGWTEKVTSRGKKLETVARLTHQVREPYWSQNSVADGERRALLGL